jgi:hypothetical protein
MNPLAVFAPLLRTLTGRRAAARSTARTLTLTREGSDLLVQLGLPRSTFEDLVASGSLHPHFRYRHFTKPKKDGGTRDIFEPDVQLKRIQCAIIARYFTDEQPHPASLAYRKKKSIADHVWPHTGAEWLLIADIEDFFPATHAGRVEAWWRERVDDGLARLLTLLTTYRCGLPQGAPTSPALSNFLNRELDERLVFRANLAGACYTRYCDDMVFSWRQGTEPPSDFGNAVRAVLHEFGYVPHPKKGWRLQHRREEPEITGVILTRHGRVRMPDRVRRAMRALRHGDSPQDVERLAGYLGYEAMVCRPGRRKYRPSLLHRQV